MGLLQIIFILVLVGVGLWALNTYITAIDPKIKKIINVVVVLAVVLWLVSLFFPGLFSHDVPITPLR